MSEKDFQKEVQELLDGIGVSWYHVPSLSGRRGRSHLSDIPDLMCFGGGCTFFLELKTKSGRVRPGQVQFLEKCNRNGSYGEVVRSLDDVLEVLTKLHLVKSRRP